MEETASFTAAVRQELSSRPVGAGAQAWAELAAIARCAGRLNWSGPGPRGPRLVIATTSGAVARRTYALLTHHGAHHPEIAVRAPSGVHRRTTYEVRLTPDATEPLARDLGLLDDVGHPVSALPVSPGNGPVPAYLRGAVLACASFSSPGREPHLELSPGSRVVAQALAALLTHELDRSVGLAADRDRVVVKSGETIGDVLVLVGASAAFLRWDEHRMRRQLRGEANRLANADAANLRRSIEAAAAQIRAVEDVISRHGWEALDDELREVGLARLANPAASLQEVGALLDPPVGKSVVHRRLRRLIELGEATPEGRREGPRHRPTSAERP